MSRQKKLEGKAMRGKNSDGGFVSELHEDFPESIGYKVGSQVSLGKRLVMIE